LTLTAGARAAGARRALLEGFAADIYLYDYKALDYDMSAYAVVWDLPGTIGGAS
jgi:hypothetical protein